MVAALAGDETSYRTLLGEVAPHLRAFARAGLARAGRPEGDLEDVVQETLLALHVKRGTWDAGLPFGAWLYGIARHKLLDELRRRGKRVHLPIEDWSESLAVVDDDAPQAARDVLRHVHRLPVGQKEVLLAMFVEGADTAQTAKRLGLKEGAVRVRLHRGLKALAALVTKDGGR